MCDTSLIVAAKNGYCREVLSLLEQGYSVEIRDKDNATALYWSCCRGHQEISKLLINFGCDVDARVTWGSTALHASCDRGHIDCARLLINSNANVNIQNKRGDTPLHVSAYRGYIDIVKLLIQAYADLTIKNEKGRTAAEEAQSNGQQNTAVLLLKEMNHATWPIYDSQKLKYTDISQRRVGLVNNQPHLHEMQESVGVFMETSQGSGGSVSDDFLRYNTNMSGFCQRTVPQEHVDSVFDNTVSNRKKENKLCRRESINGSEYLNSGHDQRRPGQSNTEVRMFVQNGQQYHSDYGHYSNGQGNGPNGPYMGNNQRRVTEENMLPPVVHPLSRSSRSSISCLQEISDNRHEELVAGFAETLQLELLKKQEELDRKESEVKMLTSKLLTSHQQVQQLRKICVNLQEEKANPKCRNLSGNTECQNKYSTDESYYVSHVGLLSFLKQFSQKDSGMWFKNDHTLMALKDKIHGHWLTEKEQAPLDLANREWTPGIDFVLIGDRPINQLSEGQRDGCCSLVFQIKRGSHMLILKMMINLINMEYNRHGDGYSLDSYLTKNFGPEHDIPCKLKYHPNIVSILHHYDGSTERFKRFLSLVIPHNFDVPIEMASRTTFLVMKKYPETLKTFMVLQRTKYPEPSYGLSATFILHILYQILSAVYHLQRNGIVHRDIKADNILLDENLRPVLTDFGLARRLYGSPPDAKPLKFSNPCQVCAGNPHAWAPELSRLHRSGSTNGMLSLEEVYSKSDAYAVSRMFYSMLRPMSDGDTFPQSSVNKPHYNDADIPELPSTYPVGLRYILQQLVLDNPADRLTARKAMLSVGMLLFPPSPGEITMETETSMYCQAQMLKLLAVDSEQSSKTDKCRIAASVKTFTPVLEADFLYNITPEEFWEIYSDLRQRQLL